MSAIEIIGVVLMTAGACTLLGAAVGYHRAQSEQEQKR